MGRPEILSTGGPSRTATWWGRMEPRRRRTLGTVAALAFVGTGGALAVDTVRQELADRARRDQVVVRGQVDVNASSSSPAGGSVWFSVVVRNDGPLPVRVDALTGRGPGLALTVPPPLGDRPRRSLPRTVEAGGAARVPVSLRLDCAARPAPVQGDAVSLLAELEATPASGRRRAVPLDLDGIGLVTDMADTVCRYRPGGGDIELSGPLLGR